MYGHGYEPIGNTNWGQPRQNLDGEAIGPTIERRVIQPAMGRTPDRLDGGPRRRIPHAGRDLRIRSATSGSGRTDCCCKMGALRFLPTNTQAEVDWAFVDAFLMRPTPTGGSAIPSNTAVNNRLGAIETTPTQATSSQRRVATQ